MAEIGGAVAGKVMDSLFVVAKKEIGYMWNCSENVENFRHEAEKLKNMRGRVQESIDISIRKGDKLSYGVEDWMKEADTKISKAHEFLEQEANAKKTCCKIGLCGNWGTLHRYGRRATKMALSLLQLQERGSTYESCVSVETPVPGPLDIYQNKDFDDLHTHNSALGDIIKSLEDESIQITGIYGLGGVGKTTLAMEVVARVKEMFAVVAFTTVSQTVNVGKIQKDLENASKRIINAAEIKNDEKSKEKIVIILDDVWEKLNLEELCIPCGSKYMNCKILLTSRSEKVCQKMNAQSIIYVNSLPIIEAWILFRRMVGERLETNANLKLVAMDVAKECGGLPLLIQAVGNALKDESIESWNRALSQLKKKPATSEMDPDIGKAFTRLKLSYDYLRSEEAKSCFLLCSLIPKDYDIPLKDLIYYMVGLNMFDDLESMEDARDRVQNAVNMLTSSCLLLNSQRKGCTKMHDVVRDVALLIASQGNNVFLVKAHQGLTEWLPRDTSLERYTGISLTHNNISKLPDYKVNVPNLEIFLVNNNCDLSTISEEFIGCMKKVKVLDISRNNISSLPQSFQLLTKVRVLDIRRNKSLHEISILGVLRDLEILILNEIGITEIPKEIAQLVSLRVLEVKDCVDLSQITHGVISALWRLEELCIEFKLKFKGASDCIVEIMSLPKLTYLDLTVPNIDDIPAQRQGFSSEKLKRFMIRIGEYCLDESLRFVLLSRSGRYLFLSRVHVVIPLLKWLKKLIEVSRPITILNKIENLNNMMPTLFDDGFNKLEHIRLRECPNVSCLVDNGTKSCDGDEGITEEKYFKELKHLELLDLYNLKVLWKCQVQYISLTKLVTLSIKRCYKLERVFTVCVAQCLVNLKELEISFCYGIEEVIRGGDGESGNIIVFPSLAQISLCHLWRLKRFYSGSSDNFRIKYPSLVNVQKHGCGRMKTWGPGIHETPNLKRLEMNVDVRRLLDGPNA